MPIWVSLIAMVDDQFEPIAELIFNEDSGISEPGFALPRLLGLFFNDASRDRIREHADAHYQSCSSLSNSRAFFRLCGLVICLLPNRPWIWTKNDFGLFRRGHVG